ncbi:hypothetical protein AVEN_15183-1 [Araneus ventricosus]|uniref:Uncharacterized protein n=1 Tax=Araneus ventricosus TaxID=182803 RepID=A0A4Y2MNP7_ARAVE|nr:hypothetical protein AVEN_15183-1 [Araneus ventricosus]
MENSWGVPTDIPESERFANDLSDIIAWHFPSNRTGNWTSFSTWQPTGQYTLATIREVTIGIIRYYGMESLSLTLWLPQRLYRLVMQTARQTAERPNCHMLVSFPFSKG